MWESYIFGIFSSDFNVWKNSITLLVRWRPGTWRDYLGQLPTSEYRGYLFLIYPLMLSTNNTYWLHTGFSYNHNLRWTQFANLGFWWVLTVHRIKSNSLAYCSSPFTVRPKLLLQPFLLSSVLFTLIVARVIFLKTQISLWPSHAKTLQWLLVTLKTKTLHSLSPALSSSLIFNYHYLILSSLATMVYFLSLCHPVSSCSSSNFHHNMVASWRHFLAPNGTIYLSFLGLVIFICVLINVSLSQAL